MFVGFAFAFSFGFAFAAWDREGVSLDVSVVVAVGIDVAVFINGTVDMDKLYQYGVMPSWKKFDHDVQEMSLNMQSSVRDDR